MAAAFGVATTAVWVPAFDRPSAEEIEAANRRLLDRANTRTAAGVDEAAAKRQASRKFVGTIPATFDESSPPRDIFIETIAEPPEATPLVMALRRVRARVGSEEEVGRLLRDPFGWLTAAALAALADADIESLFAVPTDEYLAAAAEKAGDAPPSPPTEADLGFDRGTRAQLAPRGAEVTKPRRRRREPGFATQAKQIMPAIPQWIRDAAFESIIFLFDEAPESMRPQIETMPLPEGAS